MPRLADNAGSVSTRDTPRPSVVMVWTPPTYSTRAPRSTPLANDVTGPRTSTGARSQRDPLQRNTPSSVAANRASTPSTSGRRRT